MRAEAVSTSRLTRWRPINEQRTLTESRSSNRPIRMDAREDNDFGEEPKVVSTSRLTRWRPINEQSFVLNFERADLRTDLFGWTREKTMIYPPPRVAN